MKNPKLASRFARALYDFAIETNHVDVVYHDILFVQKVITDNYELKIVFESPIILQDKKQKIFRKIFESNISEIVFSFFALSIKKRKEPQLLMMCREFIKIYYTTHNIKEAYITTAQPLSEKMKCFLKNYIENDFPYTLILHYFVNQMNRQEQNVSDTESLLR